MKFICERQKLDDALAVVIGRAKNKQKIPILSHLLIDARGDVVELTATDLDAESRATFPAEVSAKGCITVPADHLHRLVKGFPIGAQVSLALIDCRVTVKCGRSTYRLPTLPASDWPSMADVANAVTFTLDTKIIKRMFDLPQIAVSTDDARRYLHGGFLHQVSPGHVALVATDGFILVRVTAKGNVPLVDGKIIPEAAMAEIVKLACEGMEFAIGSNLISIQSDAFRYTSKLVDATYPDYQRIVPAAEGNSLHVDRADFVAALKRLVLIAGENSFLEFAWAGSGDQFSVTLTGEGAGEEIVAATVKMPEAGGISFSPRVLLSPLDLFKGDTLRLFINDPFGAVNIVDEAAPDMTVIVMPLQRRVSQR